MTSTPTDLATSSEANTPPRYVDWDFAISTGRALVPSGPKVSTDEAIEIVAGLRAAAAAAAGPVADTSRLHAPEGAAPVLIVDRPGWIEANVVSFEAMFAPFVEVLAGAKKGADNAIPASATVANAMVTAVGGKIAGAEAGTLLAFLASKVLGQYDLAPAGTPRLLLVAPNIVEAEREMRVTPYDFRLWVAMHEETHRVQFTAVPWLRDYLLDQTRELSMSLAPNPDELLDQLWGITSRLPEVLKEGSAGLAELLTTNEQRERIAVLTAVMALLEGHADVVMDDVGPKVIPSVAEIRAKFTERRKGLSSLDRLIRRLLGLEAKMSQYRNGAIFVRGVVDRVGVDDFNAVWTSPETLPTPGEIETPSLWVERVHGAERAHRVGRGHGA